MIINPASGTDGVRFSYPQHDNIVKEFSAALGRGLKAEHSNPSFLHLNLGNTTTTFVAGVLGAQGWELVTHSVLTGGHEYFAFKRQLPES